MTNDHSSAPAPAPAGVDGDEGAAAAAPPWFDRFLDDRQTRKPSAHTMKAYRQDFMAIAASLTSGHVDALTPADITRDTMRTAFAAYARDHEAASIRRCWSTWNVLCTHLYTSELLDANPMPLVGRPRQAKTLPKALPRNGVEALLAAMTEDREPRRKTDWPERDLALVLTALLAGLRAEELRQTDVGDVRPTDDGAAVIRVKGKGGKHRSIPIEAPLLAVIDAYTASRILRFPTTVRRGALAAPSTLGQLPSRAPLFVGHDGERITRGTLQSRVRRAFRRAGPDAQPVPGAMVHGFRHTYATELASSDVSVYTLMKLLGHESMTTSQRYVTAAGTETRAAAAKNGLYDLVPDQCGSPAPRKGDMWRPWT